MTRFDRPREIFGQTPDGQSVYRVQLTGGGLTADIMTWGAALQNLQLEGHDAPLVLGYDSFDPYLTHSPYFGANPGRYANRIGNAQFEIDGTTYKTNPNFLDKHTLHGGAQSAGKRNWQIADLGTSHVDFTLHDPDGMMGFPGNCDIVCSYALKDNGTLHITYVTQTDAPTPAGFAHHSYFNLDGSADSRGHVVEILADSYLPVDDELIPTGEIASVKDTRFDFSQPKAIGDGIADDQFFDHNFCLSDKRRNLRNVASAHSPISGVTMTVATTEPGLQFYAGHKINTPVPGLTGKPYGAFAGFLYGNTELARRAEQDEFPQRYRSPGGRTTANHGVPLREALEVDSTYACI